MLNSEFNRDILVVSLMAAQDADSLDGVSQPSPFRVINDHPAMDLAVVEDRQNLAQAMILRLLTPQGSLTSLGHAEYGSRLHELIGRRKTNPIRNLCRAFVLEVVAQEPRVEDKAVAFEFDLDAETPSSLVFRLSMQPKDGGDAIPLSLEVGL